VKEYLTTYHTKINEYILDLSEKRKNQDLENGGMEDLHMDGAIDDADVIDPNAYLQRYRRGANGLEGALEAPAAPPQIFFQDDRAV